MNRAAFLIAAIAAAEVAAAPGASDILVRAPLPVTLPAAGGTFIDPSFGTTILRVTDARHGARCLHAYSYWPAFNADGTRLLIACDDVPLLVPFNPETGSVGAPSPLPGPAIQWEGASWSATYPTTLYALSRDGRRLLRLDASNGAALTLHDFSDAGIVLPLRHLSVSDGGTVFAFRTGVDGAVWRRTENQLLVWRRPDAVGVNELEVSKLGNRAVVHLDDGRAYVWHFGTGGVTQAPNSTSHWDLGRELAANGDGILTGIQVRGLTSVDVLAPRNVLRYLRRDGRTPNWTIAEHVSLRVADDARIVVSTYGGGAIDEPFEDELLVVRVDGAGFVRLAHTRSCECQETRALKYWSQPRATVSRDGRWIAWTSDLGSPDRFDVLIVRVP